MNNIFIKLENHASRIRTAQRLKIRQTINIINRISLHIDMLQISEPQEDIQLYGNYPISAQKKPLERRHMIERACFYRNDPIIG